MQIVFNINPLGLEGLGATLTSLIRNCSKDELLVLWFLCSELSIADKRNIYKLLSDENFKGSTKFIDFDAKKTFGHLRSLHGDWTPYGRLLIPSIVPEKTALYLDSDLIILIDILELSTIKSNEILSAVCGSAVKWALENYFFINELKWNPEIKYFNSGVLLFNIKKWKESFVDDKINSISKQYSNEFLSADQTLLNAVCEGNFTQLSSKFNVPWYPGEINPQEQGKTIIHFVGSPKPWDLFGKSIHKGYKIWSDYDTDFWRNTYGKMSVRKLIRTWKIKKSLIKSLQGTV